MATEPHTSARFFAAGLFQETFVRMATRFLTCATSREKNSQAFRIRNGWIRPCRRCFPINVKHISSGLRGDRTTVAAVYDRRFYSTIKPAVIDRRYSLVKLTRPRGACVIDVDDFDIR